MSIDAWGSAWSEERKRAAVAGAADAHRLKGTEGGVKAMLDDVGVRYIYRTLGPFRVHLRITDASSLTVPVGALGGLIDDFKRASVHFDMESPGLLDDTPIGVGAAVAPLVCARLSLTVDVP